MGRKPIPTVANRLAELEKKVKEQDKKIKELEIKIQKMDLDEITVINDQMNKPAAPIAVRTKRKSA